ncbi:MAG: sigma-70 family RNA polymerase sigma factor [Muribaculaceae bacterium]|nr:sigma-70 family RNA polymerase sigma factor [Muribaculaceae bacterium]
MSLLDLLRRSQVYSKAIKSRHIEQLFKAHYHEMCRLAIMLLHDEEEARDIVHDTFAQLLDGDIRFDEKKARSFLMTCVHNKCLNAMRNRSAREQALLTYPLDDEFQAVILHEQSIQAIQDGIERLTPPICRDIVLMHYRDGLTFKKIAAHYQVSETTIYKHLRNAMKQLRLTLKQLG